MFINLFKKGFVMMMTSLTLFSCSSSSSDLSEAPTTSVEDNRPVLNVVIIAGQSNAVGNGYLVDLKEEDRKDYSSILYYGKGDVADFEKVSYVSSKLGKGNGFDFNSFGMEVGMAKKMVGLESSNERFGIIKCAYNGSSIVKDADPSRGDWNVFDEQGNGRNAYDLVDAIKNGTKAFEKLDYRVRYVGVAWMQGEADYQTCNDYHKRFKALMELIRKETNREDLPFAIGELAKQNYPDRENPFYKSIDYLKKKGEGLVDIVEIKDIKPRCTYEEANKGKYGEWDFVHWSGYEMVTIGEMFLDSLLAMDQLVKNPQ